MSDPIFAIRSGPSGPDMPASTPGNVLVVVGDGTEVQAQPVSTVSGVASWKGRTGVVVPVAGDYAASQITNDSSVSGATVKDALNTLASTPGGVTSWKTRTGAVLPVSGDYSASQVTNNSTVAGVTVANALDTLSAGSGVRSWNGRAGDVVPVIDDYTATLVGNDSTVAGATVADALDTLAASVGGVATWNGRAGAVVPASGDYSASLVTNNSTVAGVTVANALDTLKAASGVASWAGRTGAVVPTAGDYAASEVDNDSTVLGVTVADALDTLAAGVGGVTSWNGRTGVVVPANGDYAGSAITNDSSVAGATVSAALNTLRSVGGQLSGTLPNPNVIGIRETSGPTNLTIGTIADGVFVKRVGTTFVSAAIDPTVLVAFAASPSANQFLKGNGAGVAASWGTLFNSPVNPTDDNKVAIASAGDFSYALIQDVNVSNTANIACTKTDGNFAAVTITSTGIFTTTGTIRMGATPASTGDIRVTTPFTMTARNNGNTADLALLTTSAADTLTIGAAATPIVRIFTAQSGSNTMQFQANAVTIFPAAFNIDSATGSSTWSHSTKSSGNGATWTIAAQTTSAASGAGGLLALKGGNSTNGTPGLLGGVSMSLGDGTTMVTGRNHATGQRCVFLLSAADNLATDMPANTGDMVAFLHNATTATTANPVNGAAIWAATGAFCTRDTAGVMTLGDQSIGIVENGTSWIAKATGTQRFKADGTGISFYAGATVAQAARVGQLTDSTGGTPAASCVDVTTSALADPVKVNNNFASVLAKLNAMELVIHNVSLSA